MIDGDHPEGACAPTTVVGSIEDTIDLMRRQLLAKEERAAIHTLIHLGAKLRNPSLRGEATAAIVRSMRSSSDPQLIGLLVHALRAYGEVPEGLFASLVVSPCMPNNLIPGLVIAEALRPIPEGWGDEQQSAFWEQYFLNFHYFLPGLFEGHIARHDGDYGGISAGVGTDLIRPLMDQKVSDRGTIEAVFQRVASAGDAALVLLRHLFGWILLSDETVSEHAAIAWTTASSVEVKRELLDWMSFANPGTARRELFRLYNAEPSAEMRASIGWKFITHDVEDPSSAFATLWSRESEATVQIQLVRALGSLRSDATLMQLAHAAETSTGPVRDAVKAELEAHARVCKCETVHRVLEQMNR